METLKQVIPVGDLEALVGRGLSGLSQHIELLTDAIRPVDHTTRQLERAGEMELLPLGHDGSDKHEHLHHRVKADAVNRLMFGWLNRLTTRCLETTSGQDDLHDRL